MTNDEIYRYAGYSAFIASKAMQLMDDVPDIMKKLDKGERDLSPMKCRWLIRELNIRADRHEIASRWIRMFSSLNKEIHVKVAMFMDIDWDAKAVLGYYMELKHIRALADILSDGCYACNLHVSELGNSAGLNGEKLGKFSSFGIRMKKEILNAIEKSAPPDEGFAGRFQLAIKEKYR